MGVSSAAAFIRRRKQMWRATRTNLVRAAERMKEQADRRWRPAPIYWVGQRVWLSTKDIPIRGGTRKLAPQYVGPFTISYVISPTAVRLRLPSTMRRIHPTFHVSRVKPAVTHALAPAPTHHQWRGDVYSPSAHGVLSTRTRTAIPRGLGGVRSGALGVDARPFHLGQRPYTGLS